MGEVFYAAVIYTKNFLYSVGILKENRVDARVICVGNLTTGGVGKTPVVCEIVNHLVAKGERVAVLSRGYGGKADNRFVRVVTREDSAVFVGDEPYLIAQNTDGAAVLTCRDRLAAAKYAIENLGANVLVMDDGFSNRKIYKNLNIVLVDSKKMFGNGHLLPLGPLREPKSEIKRADKILLINKGDKNFENTLGGAVCEMVPDVIFNPKTGEKFSTGKVFAFCAIGQPEQFYNYLENAAGTKTFADHHPYIQKDIDDIVEMAREAGAEAIVTTEKDYVKIQNFAPDNIFVLKLKLSLNLEELLN